MSLNQNDKKSYSSVDIIQWAENFLDSDYNTLVQQKHPIVADLQTIGGWKINWWKEVIETVGKIPVASTNLEIIKSKLKDKNSFREGMIFLYNYRCFLGTNCDIGFIKEVANGRSVDIKISDQNNNIIFLECTEIRESLEQKKQHRTFDIISRKLWDLTMSYKLNYIGKVLLNYISEKEIQSLLHDLERTAIEANKRGYSELNNDYIIIVLANSNNYQSIVNFNSKYNITEDALEGRSILKGKGIVLEPMNKTLKKIEEKNAQIKKSRISKNSPNAIFIQADHSFMTDVDTNSREIEETIKDKRSIDLLVIYDVPSQVGKKWLTQQFS